MWVCTLWVGIKPSHSSFLPTMLYNTRREGKTTKSSNNNFFCQSVVRNTNDDNARTPMRNFSNKELPSNINVLMQQGGIAAYLPFLSSILNYIITQRSALVALSYILVANAIYLQRRSHLRKMTKRKLLQIRTTREEGVNLLLHITNLLAWQVFVTSVFPILEPLSRMCGFVSFYYFYPNANGCGIIFEPLAVQHLPMKKRQRSQMRLDWHKFSYNVGKIGRDGFRHPPSVERNLPHIDAPLLQMKHWPWRRKHTKSNIEKK